MITYRFNGDLTAAPAPRSALCDELRNDLSRLTGQSIKVSRYTDYEDWTEAALQLREVLMSGMETEVHWSSGSKVRSVLVPGTACGSAFMGVIKGQEEAAGDLSWPIPENGAAARYAQTSTFRRYAGRRVIVCDMPGEPAPRDAEASAEEMSLVDALTLFEGRSPVVKQVLPIKAMPLRFLGKLRKGEAAVAAHSVFADDPYHVALYEGEPCALLVQDEVPMYYETRYFIVNGVPVSGAGCVEAHTPLDRDHSLVRGVTHCVFEKTRNDGRTVAVPEVGERLEAFVRRVSTDLLTEKPDLTHVVIDVAIGRGGEPIVLEMNPYQNSRLYANDPGAVFRPVLELVGQGQNLTMTP